MKKRWLVVLRLGSQNVPDKVATANVIVLAMSGNEYFENPTPDLKTVTSTAEDLQLLYEVSRGGTKEQTSEMYTKEFELVTQLNALANYVEVIANSDNDIGDTIIFSAGMDVKSTGDRAPQGFTVTNSAHSGFVFITSKIEIRASYVWEYSLDQENWSSCNASRKASTTVGGLTPGKRYYFRAAIVTEEQGPWQGPINIIVT